MTPRRDAAVQYGSLRLIPLALVAASAVGLALLAIALGYGLRREARHLTAAETAEACPTERPAPSCFATLPGVVVADLSSRTSGDVYHVAVDPTRAPAGTRYFGPDGTVVVQPRAGGTLDEGERVSVVLYDGDVFEVVTAGGDRIRSGAAAEFRLLPLVFGLTAGCFGLAVAGGFYVVTRVRRAHDPAVDDGDDRFVAERVTLGLARSTAVAGAVGGVAMFVAQQFDLVGAARLVPLALVTFAAVAAIGFWRLSKVVTER